MKHTLFVLLAALALNARAGDWQKHPANPVMGDPVRLGTCFDVNVIPGRTAKYDMYFSWRPNKAIALCSSADGIKWTEPEIVLANDPTSGWEDNLNRSCTVVKDGKYRDHYFLSGKRYVYSRDDGKQKLLVMCSFSKTEIPVKFPAGFDRNKAKLVLQSYPEVKAQLQPYEVRVYLWE